MGHASIDRGRIDSSYEGVESTVSTHSLPSASNLKLRLQTDPPLQGGSGQQRGPDFIQRTAVKMRAKVRVRVSDVDDGRASLLPTWMLSSPPIEMQCPLSYFSRPVQRLCPRVLRRVLRTSPSKSSYWCIVRDYVQQQHWRRTLNTIEGLFNAQCSIPRLTIAMLFSRP